MHNHYCLTHLEIQQYLSDDVSRLCSAIDQNQNPTMHKSKIPQCILLQQKCQYVCLYGGLWHIRQMHCGICEVGSLARITDKRRAIAWYCVAALY